MLKSMRQINKREFTCVWTFMESLKMETTEIAARKSFIGKNIKL